MQNNVIKGEPSLKNNGIQKYSKSSNRSIGLQFTLDIRRHLFILGDPN